MIITTTPQLENQKIQEYIGIISTTHVLGATMLKDFLASLRDFFGGRVKSYEKIFNQARQKCLEELEQQAKTLGADAIIGVQFEWEAIGRTGTSMLVAASGTAVKLDKK